MNMKKVFWKIVLVSGILVLCPIAYAGSLPEGPYSSWSQSQIQSAAVTIRSMCESECMPYTEEAKEGGQRASYEAAACAIACFVNHLPADYPGLDNMKASAIENYENAKRLGSNAPYFLKQ